MPDLLLVDGGKGQLGAARRWRRRGRGTAVIAIAKGGSLRPSGPDRVFLPGRRDAVCLRPGDPASLFLQRVRDEAHRFALRGHRALRKKRLLRSELDLIPGVGPARRAALLKAFGDIDAVAAAPAAALARVLGDRPLARRVRRGLAGRRRGGRSPGDGGVEGAG